MAKLFTDIDKEYDDFFKVGFIARDGFYVKVDSTNFTGKATVADNKPNLEATFKETGKVQDTDVQGKITLRSTGVHDLEGVWDLSSFVDRTALKHTTKWNSSDHSHNTVVAITNTSIQDVKAKFDFQYFKGGDWTFTNHFGKIFSSQLSGGLDFTWDGKKSEINATHIGVFYYPSEWVRTWISHSTQGSLSKKTNWTETGVLAWRQRFVANATTILGFDYIYNLENKNSGLSVGIETSPAVGVVLKSKVTSGGDVEAAARLAADSNWDLLVSAGTKANQVSGKQEPVFGVGLEGRLV